ncbi:MAG TPA: hypothetical protein VEC35_23915 [Noviherbaspirillum sp.]|nr:hypothetical protein [Noviherbaspirillum sp.]
MDDYDPTWYQFPELSSARAILQGRITKLELPEDQIDEWLCQKLMEMAKQSMPVSQGGKGRRYKGGFRALFVAANFILNERKVVAPRARPSIPVPRIEKSGDQGKGAGKARLVGQPALPIPSTARTDEDNLANDKKVIDLHWLWINGKRDKIEADREFYDMFDSDTFNLELAERFAAKKWKTRKRVEILRLIPDEQWGLASLLSEQAYNEWVSIKERVATVEKILRTNAERDSRLPKKDIEDLKQLWVAVEITGNASQRSIAQVHGWLMRKKPLAKATMSTKLRRMRTWTVLKQRAKEPRASRKSS